ncbi:hypothetical protein ACHWQZ_G017861 [Mnemiopsis leidyi]
MGDTDDDQINNADDESQQGSQSASVTVQRPKKRKREAAGCWLYFEVDEALDHVAICKLCKRPVARGSAGSRKSSYSTKGLWTHLHLHHPNEKEEADQKRAETVAKKHKVAEERSRLQSIYSLSRQVTLEQTTARINKWALNSEKQLQQERLLVLWICSNTLPYTAVSDPMFQQFVHGLNPKFTIPHEKKLRTVIIPNLYEKVQFKVHTLLKQLCGTFCLTVDIWSSKALDAYFGVTIEFITKDFERKVAVLRCMPYNRRHTGKQALNKHQDEDHYKSLVRVVETRWNSYYVMAETVMKNKTAVTLAQLDPDLNMSARKQLTALDWETIKKFLLVVESLQSVPETFGCPNSQKRDPRDSDEGSEDDSTDGEDSDIDLGHDSDDGDD